ncbi:MAG: DUF4147 domain-containing protein [Candidatus Kerfeldbacteria bacterium]|nr:DUF4147 domain-containing protein [Candidatus Kerfeldbacteria bacterium]
MIKNYQTLRTQFNHGKQLLDLAEQVLHCLQPSTLMQQAVRYRSNILTIQGKQFRLNRYRHIYVVGAGKATAGMAEALVQLLGKRITAGVINVPQVRRSRIGTIVVQQASHPYPDATSVRATQQIVRLLRQAGKDDLVLGLLSGGGSSLMPLPALGVSLAKKKAVSQKLMRAGATISELNTVRKHLSAIKGGQLVQLAAPATVISVLISDVIGDDIGMIASGPTVLDTTTLADAQQVLQRYHVAAPPLHETPKQLPPVHNFLIGSNQIALETVARLARAQRLHPLILTSVLRGEAKEVARVLTAIAYEVDRYNRPIRRPALLIAGGETTVTVLGKGHGGRNQELVLAAVPFLNRQMSILSLATDGIDGITPHPVAGAMADASVAEQCVTAGIDWHEYLYANNSFQCLQRLGCLVRTGPTGTNVGDIVLLLIQ